MEGPGLCLQEAPLGSAPASPEVVAAHSGMGPGEGSQPLPGTESGPFVCVLFSLCEVGTCISISAAEKTEVQRGAATLPSAHNWGEAGLSLGLEPVRLRSAGSSVGSGG